MVSPVCLPNKFAKAQSAAAVRKGVWPALHKLEAQGKEQKLAGRVKGEGGRFGERAKCDKLGDTK